MNDLQDAIDRVVALCPPGTIVLVANGNANVAKARPTGTRDGSTATRCAARILDILSRGRMTCLDLTAVLAAEGYGKKAQSDARCLLGLERVRSGGNTSAWYWQLPRWVR